MKAPPKFIIDCGANIGLSAVFFAAKYPAALIVAIEPDKRNFEFLQKNTLSYNNVVCMNSAIWSSNIPIKVIDEGMGNWALKTVVADSNSSDSIPGISIDQILKDYKQEKIDLLKIDIEGAEKELFSAHYQHWLPKTKVIVIELHASPSDIISKTFYNAINSFPYSKYSKGENLVCDFS